MPVAELTKVNEVPETETGLVEVDVTVTINLDLADPKGFIDKAEQEHQDFWDAPLREYYDTGEQYSHDHLKAAVLETVKEQLHSAFRLVPGNYDSTINDVQITIPVTAERATSQTV